MSLSFHGSQMAFSISKFPTFSVTIPPNITKLLTKEESFQYRLTCRCAAAKQQQQRSGDGTPATKKKNKPIKPRNNGKKSFSGDGFEIEKSSGGGVELLESQSEQLSPYSALPLPKPPAGFVLDEQGKVLLASNKRIATIVDSATNFPLECVIRRIFKNSRGEECMLLCPVDMPVQILKSVNVEGWSAVSDEEIEAILPTAAYSLAKIHMHLVHSGFCYTARGGFCYTEEDVFEFHIDNGEGVDGLPTEGIEIVCFHLDGSHYMIYTPSDPLLFVAVKDENGALHIADDELLDDPAIISAIDEETEFNALVEEESALLDSLIGKT